MKFLYLDDRFVAVDKPPGLLVHRSRLDRGARRFALQMVRERVGRHVYPVHRLDKPTSGVLLFGLDPEAARAMAEAFARRSVRKTYLVVVRGHPAPEGVIDHPLKEQHDRTTDRRAQADKAAQPAVTAYRTLAQVERPYAVSRYPTSRYALLQVHPKTGRKHQIRRHLNHVAHPVIGDNKHGDYRHNRFFREQLGCPYLLLTATELAFTHPFSGEAVVVTAPLHEGFRRIVAAFGWQEAVPPAWRGEAEGRDAGG